MSRGHQFIKKKGEDEEKKQKHDSKRFHQCTSEQTKLDYQAMQRRKRHQNKRMIKKFKQT